jgi:hypothetical protein
MVLASTDTFGVQKQPIDLQIVLLWLLFKYVTFIGAVCSLHVPNAEHLLLQHFVHFASKKAAGSLPSSRLKTSSNGHSAVSAIWEFCTWGTCSEQVLVLRSSSIVLTSPCVTGICSGSEQSKSSISNIISLIKNGKQKGVLRKDGVQRILSKDKWKITRSGNFVQGSKTIVIQEAERGSRTVWLRWWSWKSLFLPENEFSAFISQQFNL